MTGIELTFVLFGLTSVLFVGIGIGIKWAESKEANTK
jgi:hypothetical protein